MGTLTQYLGFVSEGGLVPVEPLDDLGADGFEQDRRLGQITCGVDGRHDDGHRTVTLGTPIKIGETEHNQLIIRKPLGGDLRGLAIADVLRSDVDSMAKLLPRINTNFIISPEMVYAMDLSDLTEVFTQVASFLK